MALIFASERQALWNEGGDTCQVEHTDDGQPFLIVQVDDSPDSRLFIELSSYASDLTEARHALDLAIRGIEAESELADASRYLVGLAVVSYCRAILHSSVRGRLTDHVDIPEEFVDVHHRVKTYRNATVAHSQSELAVTYAFGVLDADTLTVRDVAGPTVLVPMPNRVVRDFLALINVMEHRLDRAIEPVRERLMKTLTDLDRRRVEAAARPKTTEKWAHEFNPKTKRPRYPSGHTVYWDAADYVNRPGVSGDSVPWEGWSHVREYVEEVPGRAA